jgi:hypothetical protein
VTSPPGPARCPKCDAEVPPGAAACRACGLAADRFEGYEGDPIDAPPPVIDAWRACAAAWEDDAAHERFRAAASAAGAYAFAGRCYRQAARERPGDARAADGVARVQRMAEAALLTRLPPSGAGPVAAGKRPYRTAALLLVGLVLVAALGFVAALLLRGAKSAEIERPALRRGAAPAAPHR